MVFTYFFLHQLVLLAALAATTLGSQFVWQRCECTATGVGATVETLKVNYKQTNGQLATASNTTSCDTLKSRPDGCTWWLLLNHCVDINICGIGPICYNQEVFWSDQFTVLGKTFSKNDYSHTRRDLAGSPECQSACRKKGWEPADHTSGSVEQTIEGWGPSPQAC